MIKQVWEGDIECFPNFFCLGLKNIDTEKKVLYEISEEKDDRDFIYRFCTEFTGFFVTFNGLHYDEVVLAYFVINYQKLQRLSVADLLTNLKQFSDIAIDGDNNFDQLKPYKYWKRPWTPIDFMCYWSKGLRLSKQISLKSLAVQLNYPVIQELPFPHNYHLKKEELPILRHYNMQHDLGILHLLYDALKPEVELRQYIQKEYGVACLSMDAPKISSEYLLEDFCKKTWDKNGHEKYWQYKKRIKNTKYTPKKWKLGDYIPVVKFKSKVFQELQEEIRNSDISFKKSFYYECKDTKIVINSGIGGIHVINENETYISKKGSSIRDQDIRSLYPTLLDEYRFIREALEVVLDKYLDLKKDRVDAKKKGEKIKDTFLKLVLNAFTGLVDSDVMWMYSPEHLIALRVFGQFIQLRLIEELSAVGIQVISSNTDGTTSIIPDHLLDIYHKISQNIEKEFKVDWEYAVMDKIIYKNGNNYLTTIIKEYSIDKNLQECDVKIHEKPKVKRKGLFKLSFDEKGNREIPLGDSTNEQVIAKCLNLYYSKGLEPEEVINNPEKYNLHIYDFCLSKKVNKDYTIYWNNQVQQRLNRYYFSKSAPYLYKKKSSKENVDNMHVGLGVKLFNTYEKKLWQDYQINNAYYISKTKTIINDINNKLQLKLF